eukprot:scaffold9526_cov247-Amphora_coffeaeformis.AAC.7
MMKWRLFVATTRSCFFLLVITILLLLMTAGRVVSAASWTSCDPFPSRGKSATRSTRTAFLVGRTKPSPRRTTTTTTPSKHGRLSTTTTTTTLVIAATMTNSDGTIRIEPNARRSHVADHEVFDMEEQRQKIAAQLLRVQQAIRTEEQLMVNNNSDNHQAESSSSSSSSSSIRDSASSSSSSFQNGGAAERTTPTTVAVSSSSTTTTTLRRCNFVMTNDFDMEANRLAFATQMQQIAAAAAAQTTAATTTPVALPDIPETSANGTVVVEEKNTLNKVMDKPVAVPASQEEKVDQGLENDDDVDRVVVVQAELVAPLAGPPRTPNLYQIGADLQREASKTVAEQQAAAALEAKVAQSSRARQRALQEARQRLEEQSSSSTSSTAMTTSPIFSNELREFATNDTNRNSTAVLEGKGVPQNDFLVQATDTSKRRLEALQRTRQTLLDMQAEMDAITERLRRRMEENNGTDKESSSGDE